MDNVGKKLETIRDVWNYQIWDYPFCQSEIKFNSEAKTNYFGDIIGYFRDTLDIITATRETSDLSNKFSYHISLLQVVYVQQDFIEELLSLFSTGFNKGDLKKDRNYAANREIRNELIGHPIRRDRSGKLISSVLFSYHSKPGMIEYLRYRKENDFQFESVKHEVLEILDRHFVFLNQWLDVIIEKLKSVVNKYKVELQKILALIDSIKFESLICLLEQKFKPFLENTYLYDKNSIMMIFEKRNTHRRYKIVYQQFMTDLRASLNEGINGCEDIFKRRFIKYEIPAYPVESIFTFRNDGVHIMTPKRKVGRPKKDYNYALQKLLDGKNRNNMDFDFFSSMILSQCNNKVVRHEIERMRENRYDEVEYISSYRLVCHLLKS